MVGYDEILKKKREKEFFFIYVSYRATTIHCVLSIDIFWNDRKRKRNLSFGPSFFFLHVGEFDVW